MPRDLHAVAELPQFVRDADRMGLSAQEVQEIVNEIGAHPLKGDEIRAPVGSVRFALLAGAKARAAAIAC